LCHGHMIADPYPRPATARAIRSTTSSIVRSDVSTKV
jgi:hypothetical protein